MGAPTGRRALFDPPPGSPGERAIRPTVAAGEHGRHALFSVGERRPGTLVLRCRSCRGSTRVSLAEFARRHLPLWLWIPGRAYSRLLRCPACERLTWQSARFFA